MSGLYDKYSAKAVVNTELTARVAFLFGKALARTLFNHLGCAAKILIMRDTRASGEMLESALSAGVCAVGGNCVNLGVMPVTAISYLTAKYKMDAAVMIGASSESAQYNGIRFFDSAGHPLNDYLIEEIKNVATGDESNILLADAMNIGRIRRTHTGLRDYVDHVKSTASVSLGGLKIAIDSSNGSASECSKLIFSELGADVETMCNRPTGFNVNDNCGMQCMNNLKQFVVSHKCHVGIVYSGDGSDFAIIDKNGNEFFVEKTEEDAIEGSVKYVCSYAVGSK
ncbi:MAG: hypothetical protein E7395_02355 [Ruminococcaceae bacterium]|nr:hypothetical protein [Oscillospiraceae bacterium]